MSGQPGRPEDLGRDWNNVATGPLKAGMTIELNWADVPRGGTPGYGTLVWKVVDDGTGNAKLTKLPCAPG